MSVSSSLPSCIVITGPTASGKTQLACDLARRIDGAVINADSMQLYAHLHILTARPQQSEIEGVFYALDGVLKENQKASLAWWVNQATAFIHSAWQAGRVPILVGGTGMYIKGLLEGVSTVPPVPNVIRAYVRSLLSQSFEEMCQYIDTHWMQDFAKYNEGAQACNTIQPFNVHMFKDPQRLLRAYEVFLSTGRNVRSFWCAPSPAVKAHFKVLSLFYEREMIYERINMRFRSMMAQGAVDEVRNLLKMQRTCPLDTDHPILKATGVGALTAYIHGQLSYEEALYKGAQHTRHYAKRQYTWIRGQFDTYGVAQTPQEAEAWVKTVQRDIV